VRDDRAARLVANHRAVALRGLGRHGGEDRRNDQSRGDGTQKKPFHRFHSISMAPIIGVISKIGNACREGLSARRSNGRKLSQLATARIAS
jgi:hypothetical protein